ncbi:hypothetical protein JCGZ_09450 [Jatropha curcas]|uniref:Root meristem growth factor 9 n=1 Tax=Jatropha curcas TaxID=180498 RepID=A0A067KGF1_JATCU|nr:hypothetical protein JCGZ_09450 [Jatropha curcas]
MANKVPCKHLVLVAFFLLCFVSIGARARNLRVAENINEVEKKNHHDSFKPQGNGVPPADADELVGMDYSGPKKKPPIHN